MRYQEAFARYAGDISTWIIAFFVLHLTAITVPPLEPASTWRQTDGLMVARNFYETDANILYPRVDVAGDKTGIVGCEFPFLNYLIYLVSLVFGYQHWYGRLINLIVSSIGVLYLYRLIRRYVDERTAFYTGVIVLASHWFTYCRTNIPDTFSAALCLTGLYYGIRFLYEGGYGRLALYLIFGWLGCMNKISAAAILTVMAIPFFQQTVAIKRKAWIVAASMVIIASAYAWYFYWVPHLNEAYGFHGHFFMGLPFADSIRDIMILWQPTLKRFVVTPFKYSGFAVFLFGLFMIIRKKLWLQLAAFLLAFGAYLVVVLKSGYGFQLNPYYVIMFIPPMAFVMGSGLAQISKPAVVAVLLIAVVAEGIGNQLHIFHVKEPHKSMTTIESMLDQHIDRADRIVINGTIEGDPTPMYFAHRKGVTVANSEFGEPGYQEKYRAIGMKYVVILPVMYGDVQLDLPVIADNGYVRIYRL